MPAEPGAIRRSLPVLLTIAALTVAPPAPAADPLTSVEKQNLPEHFGFGPLEIFKIEDGITQLRPADFNELTRFGSDCCSRLRSGGHRVFLSAYQSRFLYSVPGPPS